jgi:rare lipoprotein A
MKWLFLSIVLLLATRAPAAVSADPAAKKTKGANFQAASHRAGRAVHRRPSILRLRRRTGIASYYWRPQRLASGGQFDPNAMTAAHKTLPFGTRVRVRHLANGRSVNVRINDRGPYIADRIIDLSKGAAAKIGMIEQGTARVTITVLER